MGRPDGCDGATSRRLPYFFCSAFAFAADRLASPYALSAHAASRRMRSSDSEAGSAVYAVNVSPGSASSDMPSYASVISPTTGCRNVFEPVPWWRAFCPPHRVRNSALRVSTRR